MARCLGEGREMSKIADLDGLSKIFSHGMGTILEHLHVHRSEGKYRS